MCRQGGHDAAAATGNFKRQAHIFRPGLGYRVYHFTRGGISNGNDSAAGGMDRSTP
jgi:hypothetical protein